MVFFDVHRTCGRCYACTVARTPTRCPSRRVYGITDPAAEGLLGGWAQAIYLEPGVAVAKLPDGVSPEAYIGGGCGLLTAVHAIERAGVGAGVARPRPGGRRRRPEHRRPGPHRRRALGRRGRRPAGSPGAGNRDGGRRRLLTGRAPPTTGGTPSWRRPAAAGRTSSSKRRGRPGRSRKDWRSCATAASTSSPGHYTDVGRAPSARTATSTASTSTCAGAGAARCATSRPRSTCWRGTRRRCRGHRIGATPSASAELTDALRQAEALAFTKALVAPNGCRPE